MLMTEGQRLLTSRASMDLLRLKTRMEPNQIIHLRLSMANKKQIHYGTEVRGNNRKQPVNKKMNS